MSSDMAWLDRLLDPDVSEVETLCRLVEIGGTPVGYTRLYFGRYSRISHIVPDTRGLWGQQRASCGKFMDNHCLGTGAQEEYERALKLPLCQRCRDAYVSSHRLPAPPLVGEVTP